MSSFDNLIAIIVLLGLFILAYLYITKKTLIEFVKEIKDMFKDKVTEVKKWISFLKL